MATYILKNFLQFIKKMAALWGGSTLDVSPIAKCSPPGMFIRIIWEMLFSKFTFLIRPNESESLRHRPEHMMFGHDSLPNVLHNAIEELLCYKMKAKFLGTVHWDVRTMCSAGLDVHLLKELPREAAGLATSKAMLLWWQKYRLLITIGHCSLIIAIQ